MGTYHADIKSRIAASFGAPDPTVVVGGVQKGKTMKMKLVLGKKLVIKKKPNA